MGCIQEIGTYPNKYILLILFFLIAWSILKVQKKWYIVNLACIVLFLLSAVFPSYCPNPCSFPCNLDKVILVVAFVILVLFISFQMIRWLLKRLNK